MRIFSRLSKETLKTVKVNLSDHRALRDEKTQNDSSTTALELKMCEDFKAKCECERDAQRTNNHDVRKHSQRLSRKFLSLFFNFSHLVLIYFTAFFVYSKHLIVERIFLFLLFCLSLPFLCVMSFYSVYELLK